MLYELLTGKRPFDSKEYSVLVYAICHKTPQPLPFDLPAKLRDIVDTALEKDPGMRFQSAVEMRSALKRAKKQLIAASVQSIMTDMSLVGPTMTASPKPPPKEWFHFKKVPWKKMASLVFVVFLLILLWQQPWQQEQGSNIRGTSSGTPVQQTANVVIKIQPDDARVFIDDVEISSAKLDRLQLSAGKHDIRITRDGYDPLTEIFTLQQGNNRTLDYTLTVLQPVKTMLTITSNPEQANVSLDDKPIGKTPLKYSTKTTGKAVLRMQKKGYVDLEKIITVTRGQDASYPFLLKEQARVRINVQPAGARVSIDGKRIRTSEVQNLQLPPGRYRINISLDKYKTIEETFSLKGGSNPPLSFSLESKVPPGMVLIPAGVFFMGSNDGEDDEKPEHRVEIEKAFYMDEKEVTVAQYREFLRAENETNPPKWSEQIQNPQRPVVYVSWNDVVAYAKWIGKRLPTEAEWEYAARGGNTGLGGNPKYKYPNGNNITIRQVNYDADNSRSSSWENAKKYLKNVGSYPPNGYDLYDMAGNVWEWCQDKWHSDYNGAPTDGSAWENGNSSYRVLRGGCWSLNAQYCRSAYRGFNGPGYRSFNIGFRLVFVP